ncbi:bacterial alpha-L-rhamnosidase-domain-containing protein [Exophiala viscosa]|uniref:alpha-L-rhamnosidase n=1 Tax=Exophiala viscosa TaxID=2486360 RepID=A0AAN6E4M0_9EURO|nr:bacterial alpha-L-rhamnosidase-domain-containing protein [Exophiala viscosa]
MPRGQSQWPNPERSIGEFIKMDRKTKCWKAIGPARQTYNVLAEEIKKYLEKCVEPIPGSATVTFSVYMVGTTEQNASPVIMFCSKDARARKTVYRAIRGSALLEDCHGFKLGNAERPPEFQRLDLLTIANDPEQAGAEAYEHRYSVIISVATNQMFIEYCHGGSLLTRRSTLGGIVELDGVAYIFTAGHPFEADISDDSRKECETVDNEWEIDDGSEDSNVSTAEANFTEGLSRASETPPDHLSEASDRSQEGSSDAAENVPLLATLSGTSYQSLGQSQTRNRSGTNAVVDLQAFEDVGSTDFEKTGLMATIPTTDMRAEGELVVLSNTLDYALIRVTDVPFLTAVQLCRSKYVADSAKSIQVPTRSISNTDILAWTSSQGWATGRFDALPSYIRLPKSTDFEKVYTIYINAPLARGDCGTWVVDASTGVLYGHIIAGSPGTGVAYAVSAYNVLEDAKERLGAESLVISNSSVDTRPVKSVGPATGSSDGHAKAFKPSDAGVVSTMIRKILFNRMRNRTLSEKGGEQTSQGHFLEHDHPSSSADQAKAALILPDDAYSGTADAASISVDKISEDDAASMSSNHAPVGLSDEGINHPRGFLANEIWALMNQTLSTNWRNEKFLPKTDLHAIFSREIIYELINEDTTLNAQSMNSNADNSKSTRDRAYLVQQTSAFACRLLATCIYARVQLSCLYNLVRSARLQDDDLPLIDRPEGVTDYHFSRLRNVQKMFTVYNFDKAKLKRRAEKGEYDIIPADVVVPIFAGKKLGQGGFGPVTEVRIHSDYHDFSENVFALKRLDAQQRFSTASTQAHHGFSKFVWVKHMAILMPLAMWEQTDPRSEHLYLLYPKARANLKQYLREYHTPPSLEKDFVLHLISQLYNIADALKLIHHLQPSEQEGRMVVWHHDIKPENILVFDDGSWRISRVGSATVTKPMVFTPKSDLSEYSPPDWELKTSIGSSYDIWFLGCVLFEILLTLFESRTDTQSNVYGTNVEHGLDVFRAERARSVNDVAGSVAVYWYKDAKTGECHLKRPVLERLAKLKVCTRDYDQFDALVRLVEGMLAIDARKRPSAQSVVDRIMKVKINVEGHLRKGHEDFYQKPRSNSFTLSDQVTIDEERHPPRDMWRSLKPPTPLHWWEWGNPIVANDSYAKRKEGAQIVGNSRPPHTSVSRARVYITAYGVYRMFVNGCRVADEEMSPGWTSYKHRLNYQIFDVGAGWYAGRLGFFGKRCLYGKDIAVLAQLEVLLEDGQLYTFNSDESWKTHASAITHSEIYDGEAYDTREEHLQGGWCSDPASDESSWTTTTELPTPFTKLNASDIPPVRCTEVKQPIDIFRSPSGKLLVDFSQNLVGKLRVTFPAVPAETSPGGHSVSFRHAEILENGELGTRPLRSAKCLDQVILSDTKPFTWSPAFTFHGFRYVQVDGWPMDIELKTSDLEALVLHSDMRRTGSFTCSDPLVNKLHQNTLWSMRGNFLSLPTDCPQRDERLGWTGDIQVFGPSANYLYDTTGFLGNWLEDLSAEQLEEGRGGVPPVVIPDLIDNPIKNPPQAIWNDVTVLLPWDMYLSSGDKDILGRQYASMTAWVDRGIPRGPDGLWDPNGWQFGDWLDPSAPPEEPGAGRTDCILVADAYLVRVTETMARVAECLGLSDDHARYSDDARRLKAVFQHQYMAPSGLLVGDTQTALSLALCFNLHQNDEQRAHAAARLAHLVQFARYRISTGFAGTPLITHALSDTGHAQLAYRMLLETKCPSWLYPITMGATTTWERWDSMLPDGSINPGSMTSFNHYALGSIVHWLYKVVGGISPRDPGWRTVEIRPIPGGTIDNATVTYQSPFGLVACSWSVCEKDETFTMEVTIPLNSKGVIILPSQQQQQQVKLGGVACSDAPGAEGLVVGSGSHKFTCPYKKPQWPPKAIWDRSTFDLSVDM